MSLSEFELIALLRGSGSARDDVVLGIGDDAALLNVPAGQQLVACVDTIAEGVHFPRGLSAEDIAWRALAVNLSDMAAMGAAPCWATMGLTVPDAEERWLKAFARGFKVLADMHQLALVGGDTIRGPLSICVQLLGLVAPGQALLRSGASPGQGVWVTGCLGDAAAGLAYASGGQRPTSEAEQALLLKFLRPLPRVAFGTGLAGLATAAIDISDGLFQDAQHLATASGVGIALDAGKIPLSPALSAVCEEEKAIEYALTGGDDYELLFTLPDVKASKLKALAASHNAPCTRIGSVNNGQNVTCALEGKDWIPSHTGFDHFGARRPE